MFVPAIADAALECLAGGAALALFPLGLNPCEQECGNSEAPPLNDHEERPACGDYPDFERRNLNTVLESCPVGAAVVVRGRLLFANAIFTDCAFISAGAENLRIVFDKMSPAPDHGALNGKNATLFWNAAGEGEHRMRVIAHMASYGGEEAFFLWMAGITDDAFFYAARYLSPDAVPPAGQLFQAEAAFPATPPVEARGRILVAEDNEINQQIAIELLEHAGMEVEVASNGQEALDLFMKKDFDLVLMDIQMPIMDGAAAAQAIRASGKAGAATTPILAMTAHALDSDREKSLNAGMNDHITKPIDPELLYAALDLWLPDGGVRTAAKESPSAPAPQPKAENRSPSHQQNADPPPQDPLSSLAGFDTQAGLSNLAGNRELYIRLLDRFAGHYGNSGIEIRDALQRMEHDDSAHEEAVRMAHTAKGVAANLGARKLAAVAAELESAIKKKEAREELLARYELLLHEVIQSIAGLQKPDATQEVRQCVLAATKRRIADLIEILPAMMQTDWYGAQQKLMDIEPVMQGTAAYARFMEVAASMEEFDSDGVAEKGKHLLDAI